MGDFWFNFCLSTVLAAITAALKDPKKKEKLKKSLLNARDLINALYPGE